MLNKQFIKYKPSIVVGHYLQPVQQYRRHSHSQGAGLLTS